MGPGGTAAVIVQEPPLTSPSWFCHKGASVPGMLADFIFLTIFHRDILTFLVHLATSPQPRCKSRESRGMPNLVMMAYDPATFLKEWKGTYNNSTLVCHSHSSCL